MYWIMFQIRLTNEGTLESIFRINAQTIMFTSQQLVDSGFLRWYKTEKS